MAACAYSPPRTRAALLCCFLLAALQASARPIAQPSAGRSLLQQPGTAAAGVATALRGAASATPIPQPTTQPLNSQAPQPTTLTAVTQQPSQEAATPAPVALATAQPTPAPELAAPALPAAATVAATAAPTVGAALPAAATVGTTAASTVGGAALPADPTRSPTTAAGAQPVALNPLTASGAVVTPTPTVGTPTPTVWRGAAESGSDDACVHRFEPCGSDADCCQIKGASAFCLWSTSLVEYDPTAPNDMRLVGSGSRFCGGSGDGHFVP